MLVGVVDVIAEGVETELQLASLRDSGLAMAQGFYFSPPIGVEKFKAYYEAHANVAAKELPRIGS